MTMHYAPFKVAETFKTLAALYPDRIDLGMAARLAAALNYVGVK